MARTKAERKRFSPEFVQSVRDGKVDGLTVAQVQVQAPVEIPEGTSAEDAKALKEAAGKETKDVLRATSAAGLVALQKEMNSVAGNKDHGNSVVLGALNSHLLGYLKNEDWDISVIPPITSPRYVDREQARKENFASFVMKNQERIAKDPAWFAGIMADTAKLEEVYSGVAK